MPRTDRRRVALLVSAIASLLFAAVALGQPAAAADTATQINVTSIATPGITVPQTAGTPTVLVVAGVPFDVQVTFSDAGGQLLPISTSKDVTLRLSVANGPDAGKVIGSAVAPAGATTATIAGAKLTTAANGVRLTVSATIKNKPVDGVSDGTSSAFDPQKTFVTAPSSSTLTSVGAGGGAGQACTPTRAEVTCAELYLPVSAGVLSSQLLTLGACDATLGCNSVRSVVQALVDVDPNVYTRTNPVKVIVKCDKSECGGRGVNTYKLTVALTPASTPAEAPACSSKGVIQAGTDFCVDYVQSKRDNSGDTHLYLLLLADVRIWQK